jgi:NAD-dependent dihydropyrimidine dehydrogenase PreA subunit
MIEVISESRCTACGKCAQVCPMNVYDLDAQSKPVIARKADCQTCYLCEAYCHADALYVASEAFESPALSESELEAAGLLGAYRSQIGWGKGDSPIRKLQEYKELAAAGGAPF